MKLGNLINPIVDERFCVELGRLILLTNNIERRVQGSVLLLAGFDCAGFDPNDVGEVFVSTLGFSQTIQVFKSLCKRRPFAKVYDSHINKLIEKITEVVNVRNDLVHNHSIVGFRSDETSDNWHYLATKTTKSFDPKRTSKSISSNGLRTWNEKAYKCYNQWAMVHLLITNYTREKNGLERFEDLDKIVEDAVASGSW